MACHALCRAQSSANGAAMNAGSDRVDFYLEAAHRPNTQRSYESALQHFEITWGGLLPATGDSVARYLADHAGVLAVSTLKHRLAAIAKWHTQHGFVDPTRAPRVRQVLKGIKALHGNQEKQAVPLQLSQLGQVADALEASASRARVDRALADERRAFRDRAFVLLGFWRGFRGDDLLSLQVEHLTFHPGQGMTCYLADSKGDRNNAGVTFKVPLLSRWCPVVAVQQWLEASELKDGPLFRAINRWGALSQEPLHPNSLIKLLRKTLESAGVSDAGSYSGHSLRRGFAGWASANGWDVKTLMEYVGWKDPQSAMRYIDAKDAFAQKRIELALPNPGSD